MEKRARGRRVPRRPGGDYEAVQGADRLGPDAKAPRLAPRIFAKKPGDGSAREQAASCQRVLGGAGQHRRRVRHQALSLQLHELGHAALPDAGDVAKLLNVGDYVFVPGIRARSMATSRILRLRGAAIGRSSRSSCIADMTAEERAIVKAGCLINYNKFKAAAE